MYIEEAKDVVMMFTVINYILDLFRTDLDIVSVFANELSSVQALASQPTIQTAREVGFLGCHGGSNSVADLFNLYNNLNGPLKYADVWPTIDGEVGLLPKLFGAENLFAAKSAWIQEEHLLSSNSRFMLLKKSKLNEDAIISFLKQWLDGGFTRLEMMMIWFETEHWINSEQVLNSFEWTQWDPEKRSSKFEFKPLRRLEFLKRQLKSYSELGLVQFENEKTEKGAEIRNLKKKWHEHVMTLNALNKKLQQRVLQREAAMTKANSVVHLTTNVRDERNREIEELQKEIAKKRLQL
ncbi:hypothetical protein CAEBREN_05977 [Caenorhabditis brenneri]|uniref:Sdz-33 F-box domain-containing protein n=1 Tax=Caenorhabditis brenneri TaxID=135651 RepID=G0MFB9_CAEBE|nr:hypothetical protein CAEBREN_05977 [Caenorhabditis brenneri]